MSAAPVLNTRRAIVETLAASTTLTALVPAAQIFGEKSEATKWPFIRCSEFEGAPGYQVAGNVHTFLRSKFADDAHRSNELVGEVLDSAVLVLDDGRKAMVEVAATRLIEDPAEKDAWHAICSILVTIARECDDN